MGLYVLGLGGGTVETGTVSVSMASGNAYEPFELFRRKMTKDVWCGEVTNSVKNDVTCHGLYT